MKFVRLGEAFTTEYIPETYIEGYNSLIWTERNQDLGEFELKTFEVDRIKALLPEFTLVSHLETQEVMMVETHSIEEEGEGVDARPVLVVKGRSATSILEHRWIETPYQAWRLMRQNYSATAAACVLIYNAVDNSSGYDVTYAGNVGLTTLDAIPNVIVTESVTAEGVAYGQWLEQGMLLPQLKVRLATQNLGLRCLRPVLPNSKTVITVDTALATRGTVRRTVTADVSALCFEIYEGVDRSATVKFSLLQGHILKPEYLTSIQDFKSVVEMMSGIIEVGDVYRPGESGLSGWRRRVDGMDAGTPEVPAAPTAPTRPNWNSATNAQKSAYNTAYHNYQNAMTAWRTNCANIYAQFRADQTNVALALLNEKRRLNMFAGDISDLSPYKYKVHYNLGDKVTLEGEYGLSATMLVNEYVRTEDENGDRGFPGLVAS